MIPICNICDEYYTPNTKTNHHCSGIDKKVNPSIKQKIDILKNNLLVNDNNLQNRQISKVNPPPIPQRADKETVELMRNIQISIAQEKNIPQTAKRTILFRRGIILVFEQQSFELFLQQSWIKKILTNEIQISFERKFFNEEGVEHVILTILRLKIIYATLYMII